MNSKYLLTLIALGMATAYAGDRRTFDFDWQFKYFGKFDPTEAGTPVAADSAQPNNPAAHAIDGKMDTRWCAADKNPGHMLLIRLDDARVKSLEIFWENDRVKEPVITCMTSAGKMFTKSLGEVKSAKCVVDLGGKKLSEVQIKVNGTTQQAWASIREVVLRDADGKVIKPKAAARSLSPASPDYVAKGFKKVQLPHDWAIESPFLKDEPNETGKLPWNGYGWYRKTFEVPADFDADKVCYYLDFDGVMACPKVYVNGKLAGEWAYGYASFRVDITPFLKAGENLVAVEASNKPLSTRWYPGAGIYRHVWLEKTDPVHIGHWGVYVTTPEVSADAAKVLIKTTVDNTSSKPAKVTVQQSIGKLSSEPVTVELAAGESREVEQEVTVSNPKLWSCESPDLYSVKTVVSRDGETIDTKDTSFGIRHIEWRPEGFFLNGKRVQLNGVCEHHDLGPLGAAFHERAYERKIEKLKAMGCNSIRMTHNPPAPEVLDLCDKHGILVIDELFDIWKHQKYDKVNGYHVFWPKWWKKDVRNFVMRDRNHPCIIAWSGGNEITEITSPDGAGISRDLRAEFRKYDVTRPYTVGVNAYNGAYNGFGETLDVFGYNYKPANYKEFINKRPNQPIYGSETASCVATRDTYFFPEPQNFWKIGSGASLFQVSAYGLYAPGWAYCPDAEFTSHDQNPNVAGEYVWTGFDYIGEPTPYNQDASNIGNFQGASEEEKAKAMAELKAMGNKAPSRSSYFGIIDLAGFPKDTYYLYQSRWAPEVKQAHILPHWNWPDRVGKKTPVMVFSSGDEAELFLNGKSQGVRKKGEGGTFGQAGMKISKNGHRFSWEDVVYEPGELKVVVKKDGKPWATATRVTTGKAVKVQAAVDRSKIAGDARDLAFIELALVDAKGNVVPTDSRKVSFSIEGPADLVGFCNGNPVDQTCMQDTDQRFFNGRIVAVVRGERGKRGTATVTIKAKGLPEVQVPVEVLKPTREQLRK